MFHMEIFTVLMLADQSFMTRCEFCQNQRTNSFICCRLIYVSVVNVLDAHCAVLPYSFRKICRTKYTRV